MSAGSHKLHHGSGDLLDGSWNDERNCLSDSCIITLHEGFRLHERIALTYISWLRYCKYNSRGSES